MQQPYNAPAAVQAVLVLGPGSDHSCQEQVMQVNEYIDMLSRHVSHAWHGMACLKAAAAIG